LRLTEEVEGYDVTESRDAVLPSDLFALKIVSRKVPDRHLDYLEFEAGDLRGDLRLKTESIRFKLNVLDDISAEELVAGLHVGQIQPRTKITQGRKKSVHQIVERAVYLNHRRFESRSEDNISFTRHDGRYNRWNVIHRIFEIRVLNSNDIAGRELYSFANSRALPLIRFLKMKLRNRRKFEVLKDTSAFIP
jgi:hypothetical protein